MTCAGGKARLCTIGGIMQNEKAIVAMLLIVIGMFMIEFAFMQAGKNPNSKILATSLSLLGVGGSIIFSIMVVLFLQVV